MPPVAPPWQRAVSQIALVRIKFDLVPFMSVAPLRLGGNGYFFRGGNGYFFCPVGKKIVIIHSAYFSWC